MSAYRTVVVGTDGSPSSLRAVARAGALAGACGARLVLACAYEPAEEARDVRRAQEALGPDAARLDVASHAEDVLRGALAHAREAGAVDVQPVPVAGPPAEALMDLADREQADLIVVGNRGLNTLKGRLLGSVPSEVTRRSEIDVLVVHTTG
ncbi:universal stress protein [Modestobacter lapidis]|nr:universal stress protein [Modestobacter lapidis]